MNPQPAPPTQTLAAVQSPPGKLSHRKLIKWLLIIASVLIGLLLLALIIAANTFEFSGAALAAGMLLATVPVPLYAALILWIDRYEHEPRYLLFLAFLWGATASIFVALVINTIVMVSAGKFASAVVSAPIVEEISKAAILFAIFYFKSDEFNDIVDGIVYAAITALGFAMVENFSYYGRAFAGTLPVGAVGVFVVRGLQSPFLHPFLTSMTGIGLGWAAQTRSKFIRVAAPIGGLCLAIFLHSLWNFSSFAGITNGVYFLLMVPAFFAVLLIAALAVRREKKIICQQLQEEIAAGRLTPAEFEQLTSLRCRCTAPIHALFTKGFRGWNAQRKCNQAASELALQRARAAQGFPVDAVLLKNCEDAFTGFLRETR
ncbi:MAG: PrsW family intramembrane metalloprotease [Acidobacteriota bacterium]|nr:PrsW family intramembrane metalloprotease [Acidobacteriota bacterium]